MPYRGFWLGIVLAAGLAASACGDSSEEGEAEASSGGENALERTKRNVDEAHSDFKEAVEPAADFVDDKSTEAVGEGKKAVKKSADAISGADDEPDEQGAAEDEADD